MCEQLAQGRYLAVPRLGVDPGTFWSGMLPLHYQATLTVSAPY